MGNKHVVILGFLIIILFLILRLTNLTIIPIFCDEAIYIRWAQVMKAVPTLRFLPLTDGKQPLFMWILMPILGFIKDPLISGRSLSILSGLGTLIGVFFITFTLFKSKFQAAVAALFYALVPFAVFFDRMALVDSLLAMFGVWVFYLGILLIKHQRTSLAIITGLVLGGALLTKSSAMFFSLLLPLTIIFLKPKSPKRISLQLIKVVCLWLIVYFLAYGLYNILRLSPSFHMIALRNKDYIFSFKEVLSHPLDPFRPHVLQVWYWFLFYLTWPIIIAFIAGFIVGLKKNWRETIFLSLWWSFPLLAQMSFAKVFTARYLLFTIPPFLIIASFFVSWISFKMKKWPLVLGLISLFLILAIRFDYLLISSPQKARLPEDERRGYLEDWTSGYGITDVRDYLRKVAEENNIVVGTEGAFGTLPDGLMIYFDKDRRVTIIGVGLGLDKVSDQLIDSSSKGTPTFLVVNKSRMKAQNDPKLNLIMEIPKAKGPRGQDSLLLYQVK